MKKEKSERYIKHNWHHYHIDDIVDLLEEGIDVELSIPELRFKAVTSQTVEKAIRKKGFRYSSVREGFLVEASSPFLVTIKIK